MDLDGRVAFVTGGGSGIGAACGRRLAEAGARVALLSRTGEELDEVAETIRRAGGEALPLEGDITDVEGLKGCYERTLEQWNRLDVVVANAGVNGVWAPIDEVEPDDWKATVEVNLNGTFQTIRFAVPHLERGGSVIITSSMNGTRVFSNTGATAYACTKGAQVVMGRMLALELAGRGVRVNVICPGSVATDIQEHTQTRNLDRIRHPASVPDDAVPLTGGRPASSDQVADLVVFLASDRATHITGTEVWIDGGQSLLKG